jgi:hypothetical protein
MKGTLRKYGRQHMYETQRTQTYLGRWFTYSEHTEERGSKMNDTLSMASRTTRKKTYRDTQPNLGRKY